MEWLDQPAKTLLMRRPASSRRLSALASGNTAQTTVMQVALKALAMLPTDIGDAQELFGDFVSDCRDPQIRHSGSAAMQAGLLVSEDLAQHL